MCAPLLPPRSVWYKHRDNFFLPTYAELTSMALVRTGNTFYESIVFSSIVYWMIGYSRDAGGQDSLSSHMRDAVGLAHGPAFCSSPCYRCSNLCRAASPSTDGPPPNPTPVRPYSCAPAGAYFTYLLIMFCTSLSMSGLFLFIGAIAATPVHAQVRRTPSSACVLVAQLRPRLKAAAHTAFSCSCCWSWHVHDRMCAVLYRSLRWCAAGIWLSGHPHTHPHFRICHHQA